MNIKDWIRGKIRQTDYVRDLMDTAYNDGKRHGREECFHELMEAEKLREIGRKEYAIREIGAMVRVNPELIIIPNALRGEVLKRLLLAMSDEIMECVEIREEKPDTFTRDAVYSGTLRVLMEDRG